MAGDGLDARGSAIDLIARAMTINGDVWAQSIDATAGANRVDYRTNAAHAQAGDASAPAVAIDVAALGGMYANSIRLVGTEGGVGVRNAGVLTSLTGDIRVSSDGDVTIEPGARLQSATDGRIDGANVAQRGTLSSARAIDVNARGMLSNDGTLAAGGRVSLVAVGIALDRGTVQAGDAVEIVADGALSNAGGTIGARGIADLAARSVSNRDGVQLAAADVTNVDGRIAGGDGLVLSAQSLDNCRGQIGTAERAAGGTALSVRDLVNAGGTIASAGTLTVGATHLDTRWRR